MNTLVLEPTRRPSLATAVVDRLRSLVSSSPEDDDTAPDVRSYSFLAECECPDDCLRDHENE